MRRFGVIVLAAGGSSRLGRPKQLEALGGATLVERAVDAALGCGASEVVVVLGAEAEGVGKVLRSRPVRLTVNPEWQDGLGGSIAHGVSALPPGMDAVVLALADQPFVTSGHLRRLVETPGEVVATEWDGGYGSPCLFESSHFAELASLKGDRGAKALVDRYGAARVRLDTAALDVDTPDDLAAAERRLSQTSGLPD